MARPKKNTNTQALADKMRKAVLQAAIEGKLTEQHPATDGYARDLLAQIETEKQRLVKAGEIKRQKSLPDITEEEKLFDIPDNWEWVRLGRLISVSSGQGLTKSQMIENAKYPVYGGNGINGYFDDFLVEKDTLTIGRVGFYCGATHKTISKSWVTDNALIVSKFSDDIDTDFLHYFLNHLDLKKSSVATAQPVISGQRISQVLLPLPPLAEQQRIVAKLQEVMPKLDELSADENALYALQTTFPRQMQASLLQAAIEGKLTQQDATKDGYASDLLAEIEIEKQRLFEAGEIKRQKSLAPVTDEEKPFDIPDNWEWARLGSISNYGQSKKVNPNDIPSKSLVIEMEDIEKETFHLLVKNYDRTPRSSKSIFKQGDVLYGKLRPYLKKLIVTDDDGYCSTEIIPFNGFGKVDSNYLKICMSSPAIDNYVNSLTHGMDMPRLGTDKAINLLIPIPPLAEQQRIVDLLEEALPEIQTLKDIQQ